jgi:hypothetical protein
MGNIPPLGWVAIAVIVILTLIINVILFTMLHAVRNGVRPTASKPKPRPTTADQFRSMSEVLRDPFAVEQSQLDELATLLHKDEQTENKELL